MRDDIRNCIIRVVFRRWPRSQGGRIIALFPEIPSDPAGRFCLSYEHVGQHGGADYQGVIRMTKPIRENSEELENLKEELRGRGYNLKIMYRRIR
jgi:hypothetical protein